MFSGQSHRNEEDCFVPRNDGHNRHSGNAHLERHCEKTVMNVHCLNGSSMFSWQSHRNEEDCFVPRNDGQKVASNSLNEIASFLPN